MPKANSERESLGKPLSEIDVQRLLLHLGAEPLDGSGFEREAREPEFDFEFDWTLIDQTPGGPDDIRE